MLTGRAVTVGNRLAALDERLRHLERRIERIGAGQPSSAEDVREARMRARSQRARAREAEAVLGRLRRDQERSGCGPPMERPTRDQAKAIVVGREPGLPPEIEDGSALTNQWLSNQYWRAVADQARRLEWRSWSQALCLSAAAVLPSVQGVAVSVFIDQLPCPMASTDGRTRRLEEAQQILGEGPAITAQSWDAPVVANIDDSAGDDIWFAWARSARRSAVQSVWSFPHYWPDIGFATVTFYRRTRTPASSERDDAAVLSDFARHTLKTDLDRDKLSGLNTLHTLHLATGVLAERHATTIEDALARLRAHAFAVDKGLIEVAAAVIDQDLRLD